MFLVRGSGFRVRVALYADDGVQMPPHAPVANGKATIRAFLTADIAGAKVAAGVKIVNGSSTVGVIGDVRRWRPRYACIATRGACRPAELLDIAIVRAAIHDAVEAIEGRYEPYYYSDPTKLGIGSPAAAVAAAAHRLLVLLYPSQQGPLDTFYNNYLATNGLVGNPGLATGEAAAALYTQRRASITNIPQTSGLLKRASGAPRRLLHFWNSLLRIPIP